jgi:hypothetical protein
MASNFSSKKVRNNNLLLGAGISARSDNTTMTGSAILECDWLLYKYYR